MKIKRWYKLDNAAKIFPPTTDQYDTKTFRFSVALKEAIEKECLEKALCDTLREYPIFHSTLKKGFFWYYLEESDSKPFVEEENKIPCDYIYGVLYRVTYFNKRISLEVSHALTDATGALAFLKTLTANYIKIKYHVTNIPVMDTASTVEKSDDSFEKYYKRIRIHKTKMARKAYKVEGQDYPENRIKIIEGLMSTQKVLELARSYHTTVTVYLISVLIDSIGKQMTMREKKRPIYITVPVNLRKYFPSKTIRNFFHTISVSYRLKEEDSFEDILRSVDKQMKENLTMKAINDKMSDTVFLENVFILRLIPRMIKDFVLKLSFEITRKVHTMTLSNIGIVEMPEVCRPYIDYFDVFASTDGIQVCLCSYLDQLMISFTSHFLNAEIEKNFFRNLTAQNIAVTIQTNVFDEEEEKSEEQKKAEKKAKKKEKKENKSEKKSKKEKEMEGKK